MEVIELVKNNHSVDRDTTSNSVFVSCPFLLPLRLCFLLNASLPIVHPCMM